MPAPAERRDEILPLADFFLERAVEDYGLMQPPVLSEEVRACRRPRGWADRPDLATENNNSE